MKRRRKAVAKMRNGAVIEFSPERRMVLVYESAFRTLPPMVRHLMLHGELPGPPATCPACGCRGKGYPRTCSPVDRKR